MPSNSNQLKEIEIPRPATSEQAEKPECKTRLCEDQLLIEWLRNNEDLHVHVFKPAEADIRLQEAEIRKRCPALHPLSDDLRERDTQLEAQAVQDRCDARRQAWREGGGDARWPEIGELLQQAVKETGLDRFDGKIEFMPDLDAWGVWLYDAGEVPEKRVLRLVDTIATRFKQLGVRWPREIFE